MLAGHRKKLPLIQTYPLPGGDTMTSAQALIARYQDHPIGQTLAAMQQPSDAQELHVHQIMVLTMAELMAWQGEITAAERDTLQALANLEALAEVAAH